MTNAFDSMDLDMAYEIAGGYIEADDETFTRALDMVRADDALFAEKLATAREAEISLKARQDKEEEITASASEVLDNTSFLKQEFGDDKFKQDFFADEEVKEAEANTPVYDINTETQERFELEEKEKHAHFEMLFEKAKLDVWREQAGSKEFHDLQDVDKKKSLFSSVKSSFLGTIAHLRTSAQVEHEVPEAARAVQNEDKNFFAKQAGSMLSKIQDALNLKKEIKISISSVMAACTESEAKTSDFARKLANLAKKAEGKKKECFSKASLITHKAREAFTEKAKFVWGQRYEFMANMRDRSPKIVTDIAATGVLVGATALSAPWLGTAVVGYGAYKATSAWLWPIVTHARKESRLAQKNPTAPKMKFWDRLKTSANTVISSKEYYKEAGWGCAAGLVGLGAAGIASSAGANVLLQKSFQRLSSTAVYTTNSLTNAVKKLKEKNGNWWGKGMAIASTAFMAYVLTSCGENTEDTLRIQQSNDGSLNLAGNGTQPTEVSVKGDSAKVLSVQEDSANVDSPQSVVETAPKVNIPENWESSMGITEKQWERLQNIWGGKAQYEMFYQKISDDMLEEGGIFEGMTREQVLFKYERLSSWNLPQHKDVLGRMDSFFGCDGEERVMLTTDDTKSLGDVFSDGSIKDVNGTRCIRITQIDVECGEETVRHGVRVDCGCDNTVSAAPADGVANPDGEANSGDAGTPPQDFIEENGTMTIRKTVINTAEGNALSADVFQNNGIHGNSAAKIGNASFDAVSKTSADNIQIVTDQNSTGNGSNALGVDSTAIKGVTLDAKDEYTFTEVPGTVTEVTDGKALSGETMTNADVIKNNGIHGNSAAKLGNISLDNISKTNADNVQIVTDQNSAENGNKALGLVGTAIKGVPLDAEDEYTFTEVPGTITEVTDGRALSGETLTSLNGNAVVSDTAERISSEQTLANNQTGQSDNASVSVDVPSDEVTEQIVTNSEEIPVGTPAADNVPERGGYQNTGLTEAQYHRMETFYKNRFGENAFDDYMDRVTDDMRAKGGMFEGLSKAQALYSVQQMIAWSNDQHGAFAEEISTMVEYLKGECKDAVTVSEATSIKNIIDKVHENGTIDGVTGSTNKVVRYFQANGCGEHGSYAISETGAANGITQPSGSKFTRFFKKLMNISREPFFEEMEGSKQVVEVRVENNAPEIEVIQANNLGEGKVIGKADAESVSNVQADNVEVVTETSDAKADAENGTPTLSRRAEAALRARGQNPEKVTNPYLIKWANKTY